MIYPEDTEAKENTDTNKDQHLDFDGTVELNDSDDDHIPRIKGLIELLNQHIGDKSNLNR